MAKYKVYLTLNGTIKEKEKKEFDDEKDVEEYIRKKSIEKDEGGTNKYNKYLIIRDFNGTDITIDSRTLTGEEVTTIDGLYDEWRILENGFPQNYTKYKKFLEEEAKKNDASKKTQSGDGR